MRRIKVKTECLECEINKKDTCGNSFFEDECSSGFLILFREKDGYIEEKIIDLDADPQTIAVSFFKWLMLRAIGGQSAVVYSGDMPIPPPLYRDMSHKPTPLPEEFKEFLKSIGFDIEGE